MPDTCKHFTGVQNKTCRAGINYSDVCHGGIAQGIPCLQGKSYGGTTYPKCDTCEKREYPTAEEIAAEEAVFQRIIEEKKVYPAIKSHFKAETAKTGVHVMECPICKARLRYSVAEYNGHVHASCETDGCVRFMQ